MDAVQIGSTADQHFVGQGHGRKLIVAVFDQRHQMLPPDERVAVQVASFADEQRDWTLVLSGRPVQVAISPART